MKIESCVKIAYGRCETPGATIRRLEPVIQALHDYAYVEERVSDRLFWSAIFIDELDFRAMGKGVTPAFSKAGALAEAAEWLTAIEPSQLPGHVAAHQRAVENAVTIEDLLAHVQTATPPVLEKIKAGGCAREWVDGVSLLNGRTVKVPLQFVRRINAPNGLASGNRIEEAIVHATNEVFERRAHITVLRNRMVVPTIDEKTVENPIVHEQLDFVRGKGIDVWLKDLSFGGVLPCVGAYFADRNIPASFQFHHFFKVGASFNKEDALTRVFTEFAQGRRLDEFINGSRDEQQRILQHDFRGLKCTPDDGDNFLSSFMFGFVPYAGADFLKEGELLPFDKGECFTDCRQDIEKAGEICRTLGKDYVVVDLTDPRIGFPVVQVVIPGYSDILPYHPASSPVLFRSWSREDVIRSYEHVAL